MKKSAPEVLRPPQPTTDIFVYTPHRWAAIAFDIARIDLYAFSERDPANPDSLAKVQMGFSQPDFADQKLINVLLRNGRQVIGYSQAEQSWMMTSARIVRTALAPEYQGRGLVGMLMDRMEAELRQRGVLTFTQKVRILNGYAEAVRRHYGPQHRILQDYSDGIHGQTERCFLIKL